MDGSIVVTPEHVLAFVTGADKIQPTGFDKKARMVYTSGVLATASTFDMVIRIPYCHDSYGTFKSFMIKPLIANGRIGVV